MVISVSMIVYMLLVIYTILRYRESIVKVHMYLLVSWTLEHSLMVIVDFMSLNGSSSPSLVVLSYTRFIMSITNEIIFIWLVLKLKTLMIYMDQELRHD